MGQKQKTEKGKKEKNTPGTAGGPGGCDRTLAVKSRKNAKKSLNLSSIYAKILGETNFHAQEIPRRGSKAKEGEREKRERKKD